jgi:hypothetical protein
MPVVKEFLQQVKRLQGQKILTVYGDAPSETGIILRPCQIITNREEGYNHRDLYVPVNMFFFLDKTKSAWLINEKQPGVFIHPDIFKYPKMFEGHELPLSPQSHGRESFIWTTDHSKQTYTGNSGPEETIIYLGNAAVKKGLIKHKIITIRQKIEIPEPTYGE